MNSTQFAYRQAAAQGTSGIALLIVLYDTLAGDLRRAAEAERRNRIEKRCQEVNHAFLVIGHLEDAVRRSDGGELSEQLLAFYASLRRALIRAQVNRSAELLDRQMEEVLRIREIWQNKELRRPPEPEASAAPEAPSFSSLIPAQDRMHTSSWSA